MAVNKLPEVDFGPHKVSRLIVGGNPFCANSHFSEDLSREMLDYYTADRVVAVLQQCESSGINTLLARGDYHRIIYWRELHRRAGGALQWIAQTASEMSDGLQNIRVLAAAGAIGIYVHGTRTDNAWLDGKIDSVLDSLKCIRDCGVQVGLGTHNPEVVCYAEEKGWDVDFYMTCFYNIQRKPRESNLVAEKVIIAEEEYLDEDRAAMCRVIRQTTKTCLAFKILAAGRKCTSQAEVQESFRFAFANIKPRDAVVVGMFPKYMDQIRLNVNYTLRACHSG